MTQCKLRSLILSVEGGGREKKKRHVSVSSFFREIEIQNVYFDKGEGFMEVKGDRD